MFPDGVFDNSVLVVAHPDDEALWFSSILTRVRQVIVCFRPAEPEDADRRLKAEFPLDRVTFLSLASFGGYHPVNFRFPLRTRCGLLIKNSLAAASRYRANCRHLEARLAELIPPGCTVFTHNPWGEYGNEEHVQLWTILSRLQAARNAPLWHGNYGSAKTYALLGRTLFASAIEQFTLPVDTALAASLQQFYLDRGCWTWDPAWKWFPTETFFRPVPGSPMAKYGHALPLNLVNVRY